MRKKTARVCMYTNVLKRNNFSTIMFDTKCMLELSV